MDKMKVNQFHTTDVKELSIDGTTVTSTAAELNIMDGVTSTAAELNKMDGVTVTYDQINNKKCFALGNECAAAAAGAIDFDTLNDTVYGFYTAEKIYPTHVEHIVTEEHACVTTAGIASITDGTLTYATVEAVDEAAVHTHISGSVTDGTYIAANTMIYAKVTTESDNSGGKAGEGYFLVFYK
ncbi:hypothetical protein KAU11_10915 [Candidatus Babeliales bacterium]|nr:hypothetical protein [Candidatus Babeliales bacterium]